MYAARVWSTGNTTILSLRYRLLEWSILKLCPLVGLVGYEPADGLLSGIERRVKGFLLDCQMCGHCVLKQTGMTAR